MHYVAMALHRWGFPVGQSVDKYIWKMSWSSVLSKTLNPICTICNFKKTNPGNDCCYGNIVNILAKCAQRVDSTFPQSCWHTLVHICVRTAAAALPLSKASSDQAWRGAKNSRIRQRGRGGVISGWIKIEHHPDGDKMGKDQDERKLQW